VYVRLLLEAGARPAWGLLRHAGLSRQPEIVALVLRYLDAQDAPADLEEMLARFDSTSRNMVRMYLASRTLGRQR